MNLLLSALIGAVVALLYAPTNGRTSRARLRDKAKKYGRQAAGLMGKKGRDMKNRLEGARHKLGQKISTRMPQL